MEDVKHLKINQKFLAGCDEVGRGPLAGPVVAGCFYLDLSTLNASAAKRLFFELEGLGIDDSKKLSESTRIHILELLDINIKSLVANKKYTFNEHNLSGLSFSIFEIQHDEIDKINILEASLKAMGDSFKILHNSKLTGTLLIDGHKKCNLDHKLVEEIPLVKGDQRSLLIALASIVAKQYRDNLMEVYARKYPSYGFESHAGYPTKKHREAISNYGISPIHRKSFRGVKEFISK
jgi:ribonuclease HII